MYMHECCKTNDKPHWMIGGFLRKGLHQERAGFLAGLNDKKGSRSLKPFFI